jgi:hypothetical protein
LGTGSTLTACATATGFSTHSASDVVTALGTGSTLTACATATGFATASDITTAHSTTDGKIDAVDDYVDTEVTAIKAVTDKLDTALELDGAVYRYTTNALEQASGTGATAQQVWEYDTRSLTDKAGFGLADDAITAAKYDQSTAYPLASSDGSDLTACATATGFSTHSANDAADALLGRNIAGGSSTGRLVKDVFRLLRNKVTVSGGTMTVCQEDDTTEAWTASVTSDGAADPITTVDPT